ncbi:hypothetical protein KL86DPRO_20340 [uncultured delta proteobacterium]|uniref:Uncharacterized protein n=1 Tax=uncultured delta proteobacterium TaxID=34034 RepID=A0A212JYZ5_9DELT|nr:hypothetical protein KL86DPRO_20340 [uncultured delta proteobacterium]
MSTVAATYTRQPLLAEDKSVTARIAQERQRLEAARTEQAKQGATDAAVFSEKGKQLAATSLSKEEMEALSYAHLLEFETEDGGRVSVDLALDPALNPDGKEKYLAARVTITKPDGTEETLYVSFAEEAGETAAEEVVAGETGAEDQALAAAAGEALPSLKELIEQHGLDKVADPSEGLFAAIKARIESMIKAAEETAKEAEALEAVKAGREERSAMAAGDGGEESGDEVAVGQEVNAVSGKTARTLASYARTASSFSAGMGSFSRRY